MSQTPSARPASDKPAAPGINPFLILLVGTVFLASVLPARGEMAQEFGWVTTAAIAFLFFLHGAKLSREAVIAGLGHWRLHLLVAASTFVLLPVLSLAIRAVGQLFILQDHLLDGVLFLCLLPSTVQSSIAFTSIARGNVPAAICSATLSNVLGMFLTPLLVGVTMGAITKTGASRIDLRSVFTIVTQLLLPFIAGHLSRPLTAGLIGRHKSLVARVDRSVILLVVYTAFSAAIVDGLWRKLSAVDLALMLALSAVLLAAALVITALAARTFGFNKADEIAIVFCGSKKSLASGVPIAGVLFPAATVGPLIVPLMLFHQLQLMVCAILARRYAVRAGDPAQPSSEAPFDVARG